MSGGDDIAGGSGSIRAEPEKVNICIAPNLTVSSVDVKLNSTVKDFRGVVNRECSVSPEHQLLIYNGRIMTDDRTLDSYGLEPNGTVDLLEYRDAGLVSEYYAEDPVANLEKLDISEVEKLARNLETLRILHDENYRIRAICDRNLIVLRRLINDRWAPPPLPPPPPPPPPPRNVQLGSGEKSAFQKYQPQPQPQSASKPPLPSRMIRSEPRVRDRYQVNSQLQSMHSSNPQTRAIHQVSPVIGQTKSQQVDFSLTLAPPRNDGGTVPQNDGAGTGAGGDVGDMFFNLVKEKYADQLSQLQEKGFPDTNENVTALFGTAGDVEAAAEQLRGKPTK